MVVTIIGSLGKNAEDMRILKEKIPEIYGNRDNLTIHSPLDNQDGELVDIQRAFIDKLAAADVIVAISKPNDECPWKFTFGESTSYELALADYFKKKVVYVLSSKNYGELACTG